MNSGIKNYLLVALVLKDLGHDARGVRLDSGDLAELSKGCKKLIRETAERYGHDFSHMHVVASNDINEKTLRELIENEHQIDAFGIGTNLVTCQAQPALGMVYKVVELQGTARMKFSEEIGKITLPGPKSVLRVYDAAHGDQPAFDLLCLAHEVDTLSNAQELTYFKEKTLESPSGVAKPTKVEALTIKLFEGGQRTLPSASLGERRQATLDRLALFGGLEGLIDSPGKYPVYLSEAVYALFSKTYTDLFIPQETKIEPEEKE